MLSLLLGVGGVPAPALAVSATAISGWSTATLTAAVGYPTSSAVTVKTGSGYTTRTVVLQRRSASTTRWSNISSRTTSSAGKATVPFTVPSKGTWYFRLYVPATKTASSKYSGARIVRAITGTATRVSGWSTSALTAATGFATSSSVVVKTGSGYTARTVALQRRSAASKTWSTISKVTTTSAGRAKVHYTVPAVGNWYFRAYVIPTKTAAGVASGQRLVRSVAGARTAVTGWPSAQTAVPESSLSLPVHVATGTGAVARSVQVQRKAATSTTWATLATLTTTTAGNLTVTVAVPAPGAWHVRLVVPATVTAAAGVSGVLTLTSRPKPPTVTALSSSSGPVAGGQRVTVTGTNLKWASAVRFGDAPADALTVVSDTELTVTTPASLTTDVQVTVVTPGGTSAVINYTYTAPAAADSTTYTPDPAAVTSDPADVLDVQAGPTAEESPTASWQVRLTADAALPSTGDTYYLPPAGPAYAAGLTGKVTAVSTMPDLTSLVVVAPLPADTAFSDFHLHYSGPLTDPDPVAAADAARATAGLGTISFGKVPGSAFDCVDPKSQPVRLNGSVTLSFSDVRADFQSSAGSLVNDPYVSMWVAYTATLEANVTAERTAMDCKMDVLWQNTHKKVIPLGSTGATLSFAPDATFKVDVAGTVTFTQVSYRMVGFQTNPDGTLRPINASSADPLTMEVSASLTARAYLGVAIQLGVIDRVGVGTSIGGGVNGVATLRSGPPAQLCLSATPFLQATTYAFLDVFVKRWTTKSKTYTLNLPTYARCFPTTVIPPPNPPPAPTIATTQLPNGTVGVAYAATLSTTDGRPGTWQVSGGALPAGLSLVGSKVAGVPSTSGSATFQLTFTDDSSQATTVTGSLRVLTTSQSGGTAVDVQSGGGSTCAISAAGGLRCWGMTSGSAAFTTGTPVAVPGLSSGVRSVSVGSGTNCAVTSDGAVKCWGYGESGQLGDGKRVSSTTPVVVPSLTSGVAHVAVGGAAVCALLTTGAIKCWGSNLFGEIGNGSEAPWETVPRATPITGGAIEVSTSGERFCALFTGGAIKCWGRTWDPVAQGYRNIKVPTAVVTIPDAAHVAIADSFQGADTVCVLTTRGAVKCVGGVALGNGTSDYSATPVLVSGLRAGATSLSSRQGTFCATLIDGRIRCWGNNYYSQIAPWAPDPQVLAPVTIVGLGGAVSEVSAGATHTCALLASGGLKCWGDNYYGQLGVGSIGTRDVYWYPTSVVGFPGA